MKQHSRPTGFTLVEVMVAMVIGMIGIVIMMQVFATAEGQKRTTTGTGDAQSSGAMALYELQRDIRRSGYGLNSLSLLTCGLALGTGTLPALGPAIINPLKADGITPLLPAADANTDTLLVTFGNSAGSPEGDPITTVNNKILAVETAKNFVKNDRVIAAPASDGMVPCTLTLNLDQATDVTAQWVTVGVAGVMAGNLLFNFGAAPTIRAYAIRAGNLTVCDYTAVDCATACTKAGSCSDNWVPIANNIVSLQAQYGRDTNATAGVDIWDQTTPTTACEWIRTSALRIALVARNSQVDKGAVTLVAPTWEGGSFDLTKTRDSEDAWQNYRYKVFETVVPIRNLPWMARCT